MRPLLFLLASVGGFLALAHRYRKHPGNAGDETNAPAARPDAVETREDRQMPVHVGDGSLSVSAPGIDDANRWTRVDRGVRSPFAGAWIGDWQFLVNGRATKLGSFRGERVITIVYDGRGTLTLSTPESADRHLNIVWKDPDGTEAGRGGVWRAGTDRLTYETENPDARITLILVDGQLYYHAPDFDTKKQRAKCELRLSYGWGER